MFNKRLKEERTRLTLSQTDFGKSCGVTKQAQIRYEKGERQPNSEYLQKAHEFGVDVSYLLTGIRSDTLKESAEIDNYQVDGVKADTEKMRIMAMINSPEMVEIWHNLSAEQARAVMQMVKALATDV